MFYAIKVERTGTHARTKKSLHKQIFMYGYRVLWAGFVTIAEVNKRTNEIARSIVNNVLNNSVNDTDIAFDFVKGIVNVKVHRNQRPIPVGL